MTESLPKITEKLDEIKEFVKSGFGLVPTKEFDTTWGPTLVYGDFRVAYEPTARQVLILTSGITVAMFDARYVDSDTIAGVIYFVQEER